jgi:hypothetical protein
MRREYVTERARGINLATAGKKSLGELKTLVEQQKKAVKIVNEAITRQNRKLLENAARMAVVQAFIDSGDSSFEAAEAKLNSQEVRNSDLYKKARKHLTTEFGLTEQIAEHLLQGVLVDPILTKLSKNEPNPAQDVIAGLVTDLTPGLWGKVRRAAGDVMDLGRKEFENMDAPPEVREFLRVEETKAKFGQVLDQLEPGTAMNIDAKTGIRLAACVKIGIGQVGVALEMASSSGFAVTQEDDGTYRVLVSSGKSAAGGASVGAFEILQLGLGVGAETSAGMAFSFATKEKCAEFLQKVFDNTFAATDTAALCSSIAPFSLNAGSVTLQASLNIGEIKLMENRIGVIAFSAGFEAGGHVERRTDTDPQKGVATTRTTYQGRLSISAGVSVLEDGRGKTTAEKANDSRNELRDSAKGTLDDSATSETGQANSTLGIHGKGDAGVERDGAGVTASASLSLVSVSSLTRSTSDPSILTEASYGAEVLFSGKTAREDMQTYCRNQLGIDGAALSGITDEVSRQAGDGETPDFTLSVNYALKESARNTFRVLESQGKTHEAQKILDDPKNYGEGTATLTFAGREKALNISVVGFRKSISGKEQRTASFIILARAA